MMQTNTLPDMQFTMLAKKLTRWFTRILTPNLQKSTALLTTLEINRIDNADVLGQKPVKNDALEMSMSEGSKQVLVRVLPKAPQL